MSSILSLPKKETQLEKLVSSAITFLIGFAMAGLIMYVYNDFNTAMQLGWMHLSFGQVYLTLVAVNVIRIWFYRPDQLLEASTKPYLAKELLIASITKFFTMVFLALMYIVVKFFVF